MADIYLPTQYQQYIHLSRYSRWDYDKQRRETWKETVDRYFDFFRKHLEENCNYIVEKEYSICYPTDCNTTFKLADFYGKAIYILLETVLGPFWVWLVIKEQPSFETIVGGVVIVVTITVHSFLALKKKIIII